MSSTKLLTRSFAGGEITPEMYGRLDNVKFQTGVAQALNVITLPHGPLTKRSGSRFTNYAGDPTKKPRIIPFAFSSTQTMIIELGNLYVRFHTDGGTLLEASKSVTAMTSANPGVFTSAAHGFANNDALFLLSTVPSINARYYKVANSTANTFTLKHPVTSADIDTSGIVYAVGMTVARVYTIASPYLEADLYDITYTQSADVLTLAHAGYQTRELRRLGAASWTLTAPTLGSSPTPTAPTATVGGAGGGSPKDYYYKVTSVTADGLEESLPVGPTTAANRDLSVAGNKITVAWVAAAGLTTPSYRVYKAVNRVGGLYGFIGETKDVDFVDDNITADYSRSPPSSVIRLDTAGNYPAAVSYHEQRKAFGGTTNNPQAIYMTRVATENNLAVSVPSNEEDALSVSIKAQQQNAVRHLVPLNDLLALTVGGVWRVYGQGDKPLLPSTLATKGQTFYGANNVQPQLTGNTCLYVEKNGRRVRDVSYSWQAQVYTSTDRSLMAPHLFQSYSITDIAFSRSPDQVLWAVRSDGRLLSMAYVPEQEVYGWTQHSTNGAYRGVAVVTEGNDDVLYAVTVRVLHNTAVYCIERSVPRMFSSQEEAYFVDCGSTYEGPPVNGIQGLSHLEGRTVVALADGAVVKNLVVSEGAVQLDVPASTVHVGLAYTADVQTLPLSIDGAPASGQGTEKNTSYAYLRVNSTGGFTVGPDSTMLTEPPLRTNENYDTPTRLQTGIIDILIQPDWGADAQVWLRSADPVPFTLAALTTKVGLGG